MSRAQAVVLAIAGLLVASAAAQSNPYSAYIPTAVPTATTTLYKGSASIAPGRVGVDKAGNVFYVGHTSGSGGTLYEIPAASPAVTVTAPTALISGLGQLNSNSAFVDSSGALWVSNGNGAGGSLIEIPAANGVPNVAAIKSQQQLWRHRTSAQQYHHRLHGDFEHCVRVVGRQHRLDAYGAASRRCVLRRRRECIPGGLGDSVSNGSYNRLIQFNPSAAGTVTVLADNLKTNTYAQVTVAGDGNVYYCDSVTGNASGGQVSLVSSGALTTVGNTANSSLTLLNAIVKVAAATGITTDPWGDLIISGPKQISEVPLEQGALNFIDQFNLLVASGSNSPVSTNNVDLWRFDRCARQLLLRQQHQRHAHRDRRT